MLANVVSLKGPALFQAAKMANVVSATYPVLF